MLSFGKGGVKGRKASGGQAGGVEKACEIMTGAMGRMEKTFLDVGGHLEQLDASSRLLIDHCENLIHLASGGDEGEQLLREATDLLREPLAYIDFCLEKQQSLLVMLEQCERQTHAMLGIRSRMHDAIAPLTFMAVLFKIESAYLNEEHRDTFLSVTSEVERLHHLVDETFARNAEQLDLAHVTLSQVRRRLESEFKASSELIERKRTGIQTAIGRLDDQLSHNAERDHHLHEHSRNLAQQVSSIVMGLQFQDIVKQKCDHVQQALLSGDRQAASWPALLTLQSRQLKLVQTEVSQGVHAVVEGLETIEAQTDELNRSSVSLENIESMTAAVDGMVQLLLDTFSDINEIISMVTDLTRQGDEAVQPARGLARNLTSAIVELSINMRLIALNAQIRSVQSGQGTGLEVLASRTADISGEINEISGEIAEDLAKLHQGIDSMLLLFSEFREQGQRQKERLAGRQPGLELRLHALRDKTLVAVAQIGTEVDSLQSFTKQVRVSLSAVSECGGSLDAAVSQLDGELLQFGNSAVDASSFEELAHSYTMASERQVHEEFLRKAQPIEERICADAKAEATDSAAKRETSPKQPDSKPGMAATPDVELF